MTFLITTYGGGEAFYYVFEGLAAVLSSGGFLNNLFRLGGFLGVSWAFVLMAFRGAYEQAFFWLFWFLTATFVLFGPKATVWIKDPLSFQAARKVDHVPWALAALAGTTSSLGTALTEKLESVFTLPDYMPYHQTGTVFASRLVMKAHHLKITDPDFKTNMERFVNRCIVFDALMGQKYTLRDLQHTPDIWELVRSHASPVLGFLYKEPGQRTRGQIVTCREGAQKLQHLWGEQLQEAARLYGSSFFHKDARAAQQLFLTALPQSFQLLTKVSLEAPKILQQEMMIHALREGSQNKLDELRGSVSYATAKAFMQQEITHRAMGEMAGEVLVIAKAVLEALCYASFIFVMLLSLMHQGYRVLAHYAGVLMWLQMWAPLYAVLNLFMTLYGQYRSSNLLGSTGLTLMTSAGLNQIQSQVASLAGWLSCSLPFLSYAIVKGGVGSFLHLAGTLLSSTQGAISSASGEAAGGNISLGNVTLGTQAYQNATAFQTNRAPSYREGHFENVLEDGTVLATQADGSAVFRGGAGFNTSTLRVKANVSENFAQRAEEQRSHQESILQAQSEDWATTRLEAARQVLTLAQSTAKGQNSSEGYDHSKTFSQGSAVSQAFKFSKTIQDQYGFSEKQATDITASLMAGTPKWLGFLSADLKGSGSSGASREKTAQDIENMAKERGVTNSLDQSVRSVQDHKFSDSQSREARLAQDIGQTFEKAESIRSSMTKTQQAMDSYAQVQALSKTGAFNIDRDESQGLLEFVSNQTIQGNRIGKEGAYRLLNAGGFHADALVAAFRDDRWNQIQSRIERGHKVTASSDLYPPSSGDSLKGRVEGSVANVNETTIGEKARFSGLTQPVSSLAREQYVAQRAAVSGEMSRTEESLTRTKASLQEKTDQARDRSLVGASVFNAVEGVGRAVIDTASSLSHAPETIKETVLNPSTYTSNFKKRSEEMPEPLISSFRRSDEDSGISGEIHSSPNPSQKPSGETIPQFRSGHKVTASSDLNQPSFEDSLKGQVDGGASVNEDTVGEKDRFSQPSQPVRSPFKRFEDDSQISPEVHSSPDASQKPSGETIPQSTFEKGKK